MWIPARFFYAFAILLLFRLVWQAGTFYYDDLDEVNYFFLTVVVTSLPISLVAYLTFRRYLSVPQSKLIAYMCVVAACTAFQVVLAHRQLHQTTKAIAALEALLEDFSLEKEALTDPRQKYPFSEYGELCCMLWGVHELQCELCTANEEASPCFARLVDCCQPEPSMLVDPAFRKQIKKDFHDLIDDLNSYQWRLSKAYKKCEPEFRNMHFTNPATKEAVWIFFEERRKKDMEYVRKGRQLAQEACNTWLKMLDVLNAAQEQMWWDEELVFFDHTQARRFGDLYHKMLSLFRQLEELGEEEKERILGTPPIYGLT